MTYRELCHKLADLIIDDLSIAQILDFFERTEDLESRTVTECLVEMENLNLVRFYKFFDNKKEYISLLSNDKSGGECWANIIVEQTEETYGFYQKTK